VTAAPRQGAWTNPSVLAFAAGSDPLDAASAAGRRILEAAAERGLTGPPLDILALAELLGLRLRPHNDVADATITTDPVGEQRAGAAAAPLRSLLPDPTPLVIAYNPSRPKGRLRFSLAHEIAHALFPDVAHATRHRTPTGAVAELADTDEWELELLCNVVAGELLLPPAAVEGLLDIDTDIDFIMETRRRWDVSTEALLRRLVQSSRRALTLVAASRPANSATSPLRVDYVVSAMAAAPIGLTRGQVLPEPNPFARCTAVGQTVRGETVVGADRYATQVVGVPGYPGARLPRVLGLLEPPVATGRHPAIRHVSADLLDFTATAPGDPIVVAHVVTDAARAWSRRGVAAALTARYPRVARAYRAWAVADAEHLRLGKVHAVEERDGDRSVWVASLVAQHGYGPGKTTRLRYDALRSAFATVGELAQRVGAEVHVPRLGAGQAGGRWDIIEDELVSQVGARGVTVIVHTLPARANRVTP
jgi:uncharacterized protein DUF955